jgi:hypothetical protein
VEEDALGSEDVAAYQAWVASRVRGHLGVAGEPLAGHIGTHRLSSVNFLESHPLRPLPFLSTCVWHVFRKGRSVEDQHSVGWSGGHFLLYHEQLRLALLMDPSHRCARDLNLAYSDADCWGSILLMSSCWNLKFPIFDCVFGIY